MSARYGDYRKRTPGPHDYDNDTLKVRNKSPGYTMATRSKSYRQLQKQKNQYKPAPSAYDSFKGSFNKHTKTVFGTATRKDLTQTQKTPAPNYYGAEKAHDYTDNNNPRCAIGGEFRKTDFRKGQDTPGPAFYSKRAFVEENKQHNKGYSCRNKTADLIALEISKYPAPGDYQSHLKNKNRAPRISNPTTQRKTFMDDMQDFKKSYPGPGNHDPGFVGTKYRSTSAFNFGKANRKDLYQNQKTPGPVVYENDKINLLNTAPRFSVGKTIPKNQFLQVNPQNPGPGQYDPSLHQVKDKSKSYNMPKEKRPDFEKQRFKPGPGYYNLRGKQKGPKWGFSSEKRIAFTDKKNQGKEGMIYDIPAFVPNPPKYMNVQNKVNYGVGSKSKYSSTGFTHKV